MLKRERTGVVIICVLWFQPQERAGLRLFGVARFSRGLEKQKKKKGLLDHIEEVESSRKTDNLGNKDGMLGTSGDSAYFPK